MRCGDCKFWEQSGVRRLGHGDDEKGIEVGECSQLNNDFCCGGYRDGKLAGCTGGGSFETVESFGCVLFEKK